MDDYFKAATQRCGVATRLTAAERQFERFVSAVRQFDCDDNPARFEETLARLVAAGPVFNRRAASDERNSFKMRYLNDQAVL